MKRFHPAALFWRCVVWASLLAPLAACSPVRSARAPWASVTAGAASVTQRGAAEVPANAETRTERRSIPLPAATELVFDDARPGAFSLRLARDSTLTTDTQTQRVEAPKAFAPPLPPSPSEISDGRAVLLYRIGLAAGIAAGLFGLIRDWNLVATGGGSVAGACACALFVKSHPLLFVVIGLGVALAVVGPWIWHTRLKNP